MSIDEQAKLESMLRNSVREQDLNTTRVAAFSELCDRMLRADSSSARFVRRMADLANEGEREANRVGADDIAWAALARILRDSVDV